MITLHKKNICQFFLYEILDWENLEEIRKFLFCWIVLLTL